MNWRVLAALAVLAGLALGFAPLASQAAPSSSGVAAVTLNHHYIVNTYGYGVLNDSFTFKNNGTSAVQIPTLQVGLSHKVSARITDLILSPSSQFTLTQSQSNGNTTVTISPDQATLNAGANATVSLQGFLSNIFNYSSAGFKAAAPVLILSSPSVNMNLTLNSFVTLPSGGEFTTIPPGFTASANNQQIAMTRANVQPVASETYLSFNATSQSGFTPLAVTHLVRTIVPSANGSPMVEDTFTVHNIATYNIAQVHLNLLYPGLESVTQVPSTEPPLLNPVPISLSGGTLTFASSLLPQSNTTFTLSYPVPSKLVAVSGNSVTITVPYKPLLGAPVKNYSIILAPSTGIVPSGQTSALHLTVTPLTQGSATFAYTVSVGWAADQAIPAGILVFAVAFAMFAIQRPSTKEEGAKALRNTSDVLRAFEEKTGLETQYMNEFASAAKGSISKNDFDRMRNEVSELRSRAIQRLNEMKQVLGSGRQYDALTRVAEAEKEEDRAFRDLLNLYMQYHGSRMNEETFKRLQPNYRKRVDSAINHLSDLLHEAKTEEK